MKLELGSFPVMRAQFDQNTRYNNGTLDINKEELLGLMKQDTRIAEAELDIVSPGEQTRIVNVRDVVEPRMKISGPGCVFPGILGPVQTVGEGRTHSLTGVTVVISARYDPVIQSGTSSPSSGIIDMWGPGAQLTPFASTINVVPVIKLINGVSELEAHATIQMAAFKVAKRLAETVKDSIAADVEVFELFQVDSSLPRIVYIGCYPTWWHDPHAGFGFYGLLVRETLPFLIHPNELFDGVVTHDARRGNGWQYTTWQWMKNPVVHQLLREHGKRLNFLGVILQRIRFEAELGKEVSAACTSQMTKMLGANGAIFTGKGGSGSNFEDVMLTVQACEKQGVKTVLIHTEWGTEDGTELPFPFYVPEATAIVSTGSHDREIRLQAPSKVIGIEGDEGIAPHAGDKPLSPWGEIVWNYHANINGGLDHLGGGNMTCREY